MNRGESKPLCVPPTTLAGVGTTVTPATCRRQSSITYVFAKQQALTFRLTIRPNRLCREDQVTSSFLNRTRGTIRGLHVTYMSRLARARSDFAFEHAHMPARQGLWIYARRYPYSRHAAECRPSLRLGREQNLA